MGPPGAGVAGASGCPRPPPARCASALVTAKSATLTIEAERMSWRRALAGRLFRTMTFLRCPQGARTALEVGFGGGRRVDRRGGLAAVKYQADEAVVLGAN